MKYLQTFEKLGVSDAVTKISDWIWKELIKRKELLLDKKPISFIVPIKEFEEFNVPELKDLNVRVHYNTHNLSMSLSKYSNSISATLNISAYHMNSGIYGNDEHENSYYKHMVVHEIHHLLDHLKFFQKNKKMSKERFDRLYYELDGVDKLFKWDELHDFLTCVYLSGNTEMEARIDQCYHELVGDDIGSKTTKQNFEQNLKKTWVWVEFSDLEKIESIMKKIKKRPLMHYKQLLHLKNKNIRQKSSSLFDIFNVFKDVSQLFKIGRESKKINVTEEQALIFFNRTEKYIVSQREKMRRKLYKLSGHFI